MPSRVLAIWCMDWPAVAAAAAATAGQSMHQMASTRAMARYPPTALIGPKDRPQARMASRTRLIRPHPGVGAPQPAPVTS